MIPVVVLLVAALVAAVVLLFRERAAHHDSVDVVGVYRCGRCGRYIPLGFAHRADGDSCVVLDRTRKAAR